MLPWQRPEWGSKAAEGLDDFRNFLYLGFKVLNLPAPTPLQYEIADWLQNMDEDSLTEAFRGVGKSIITALFVLWCLYMNPQLKIMVVSASADRANSFSTFCKRLIVEWPLLHHLKPRENQRDSNIAFDVGPATPDQSPSVKSVGITGQLTGSRADIIVPDDIETPANSYTSVQRERLRELVTEFYAVLKPYGAVRWLGTPQTEESLYDHQASLGTTVRIWPAEGVQPDCLVHYGDTLSPYSAALQPGEPAEPTRFNEEILAQRRAKYGESGYQMQFMLNTGASDHEKNPLKLRDLIVLSTDKDKAPQDIAWSNDKTYLSPLTPAGLPGDRLYESRIVDSEWIPYQGKVMVIDPSGRGKDDTVAMILGYCNTYIYLLDAKGWQDGYADETLLGIAEMAKEYKVGRIVPEANFGDGMFGKLLEPMLRKVEYPMDVEDGLRVSTMKEARIIDTLEPVLKQHKLVVSQELLREDYRRGIGQPKKSLMYQLTRIFREPKALAHDDWVDCLHLGVGLWAERLGADKETMIRNQQAEEFAKRFEDFQKSWDGSSSTPTTIHQRVGVR